MELVLTIIYSVLSVCFAAIGVFKDMKATGKFSLDTRISLTVLMLMLITNITISIFSSLSNKEDNRHRDEKIENTNNKVNKIDSEFNATK
jgi:hypothetical protein